VRVRKAARALLVGVVVPGLWLAAFTSGAGAGAVEFEILKTVNGAPPPGTVFEVTLACDGVTILPGGEGGQSQAVVRFDAAGTPQDVSAFRFDGEGTCTVTETQTGGASSVTYECFIKGGEEGVPGPCTPSGPQSNPVTLNVTTPRSPSSVVVTNTFEPQQPPEPPRPPAVVAPPVPAAPRLTG
jgi:hypothetical protein